MVDSNFFWFGDPSRRLSPVVQILADKQSGRISEDQANSMIKELEGQDVRNDLSRYFYRRAINQQYSITVKGGTGNNDYLVGFGFDNNLASLVGDKDQRFTLNSQFNFYPSRKLSFTTGINIAYTINRNNSLAGSSISSEPYTRLVDENGDALEVFIDYSPRFTDSLTNLGLLDWKYKPLEEIQRADKSVTGIDNRINLGIRYNIIDNLRLDINYQFQKNNYDTRNYASVSAYETRNLINLFSQHNPDGSFSYPVPMGGILSSLNSNLSSHQLRAQLNYNYGWKDNNISAIIGSELRTKIIRGSSTTAYGYDEETETNSPLMDFTTSYPTYPFGQGRQIPNNQGFAKNTDNFLSYYANAIYNYRNIFGASISGRIDNSTKHSY